jgi:hypothetical protein
MLKIEGRGAEADSVGPEAFMLRELNATRGQPCPPSTLCCGPWERVARSGNAAPLLSALLLCGKTPTRPCYKEGYIHGVNSNSKWYKLQIRVGEGT